MDKLIKVWESRDKLVDFHCYCDGLIVHYGIAATGILSVVHLTKIRSETRGKNASQPASQAAPSSQTATSTSSSSGHNSFLTISSSLSIRRSIPRTISRLSVFLQMLNWMRETDGNYAKCRRIATVIEHVIKKLNEQPLGSGQTLSANISFTFGSESKSNFNPSSQSLPQPRSVRSNFNLSFGHAGGNSSSSQSQDTYPRSSTSQVGSTSFDFSTSANQSLYATESHTPMGLNPPLVFRDIRDEVTCIPSTPDFGPVRQHVSARARRTTPVYDARRRRLSDR